MKNNEEKIKSWHFCLELGKVKTLRRSQAT
jgi:hypothetical protein